MISEYWKTLEEKTNMQPHIPLVNILKYTAWSVCGGEDTFVCWNSGSLKKKEEFKWGLNP